MPLPFLLSIRSHRDLDDIWNFIARDSEEAAHRVESAILLTCEKVGRNPNLGKKRPEITARPVRFMVVTRYPNYIVIYRPDTRPVQIVAVIHGRRNLVRALR